MNQELIDLIRAAQQRLANRLGVAHVAQPSQVANAEAHVGPWAVTASWRLAPWPEVSDALVADALFLAGEDPQFILPYLDGSPDPANLVAVFLDQDLAPLDIFGRCTRLDDEITVSLSDLALLPRTADTVVSAALRHGWHAEFSGVSTADTGGRRTVSRVLVDEHRIYPPRQIREETITPSITPSQTLRVIRRTT